MGVTVSEFLELNAIETVVELVRQDVGVALLPYLHGSYWADIPQLRVVHLPEGLGPVSRAIGMLERRDHARQSITAEICARCAVTSESRR